MNFVMRKSEARISDRHYLMDIPVGALVIAPDVFFARFGKSFSAPSKETLGKDIQDGQIFHAVPSDEKRKPITPYVVRRIHNSRIKDALAGKMAKELLSPKDHIDDLVKENEAKSAPAPAPVEVNIFSLTLPQLREFAAKLKIKGCDKMPRKELQKALQAATKKDDAEK